MFKRLREPDSAVVTISVDGKPLMARAGDTVAAALLLNQVSHFRTTPVSGSPRAPYCMMGVCFDCLMTIDGVSNKQSCLMPVQDGMRVQTQKGMRSVTP